MNIEGIAPLVLVWVVWSVINRIRKIGEKRNQQPQPYPDEFELPAEMEFEPEYQTVPDYQPVIEEISVEALPAHKKRKSPNANATAQKACSSQINSKRSQLRKAVIWSEILAPPLALRKGHDYRP